MILDKATFARVRTLAADLNLPAASVQYCGATDRGVQFRCSDGRFLPRKACVLVVTEHFQCADIRPLFMAVAVGPHRFNVTLVSTGRTVRRAAPDPLASA